MAIAHVDWNKVFEFTWRILVFIVAIGIIFVVSTNWNRWEGGAGWQRTNDAYLQADLTPIAPLYPRLKRASRPRRPSPRPALPSVSSRCSMHNWRKVKHLSRHSVPRWTSPGSISATRLSQLPQTA